MYRYQTQTSFYLLITYRPNVVVVEPDLRFGHRLEGPLRIPLANTFLGIIHGIGDQVGGDWQRLLELGPYVIGKEITERWRILY